MHIALDLGQSELDVGAGGEAGEVVDHVVEDEVEAAGHAGGDEAVELHDVGVVEAAEDEDLPGHEPHALGLQVVEAHLLERHDLAAHRVPRLVHIAVRALPDLVDLLEGVGAARGPAVDGLAGDGGEPGGPAGGDLLPACPVGKAAAETGLGHRARRPGPPLLPGGLIGRGRDWGRLVALVALLRRRLLGLRLGRRAVGSRNGGGAAVDAAHGGRSPAAAAHGPTGVKWAARLSV